MVAWDCGCVQQPGHICFLFQVMDSIYSLMSIEVPKVLKKQQADSLFTSMNSEKKDFVTKDEFIAYFNKDEVGKYL
jgi:hypothetical protein